MVNFLLPVHLPRGFLLLAAAGLGLLPAARAGAQLVDTSPFMAPGTGGGPNGGAEAGALELRGIMSTPAGMRYYIFNPDPLKKSGAWVGVNERGNSFTIKSADLAHQMVTVQSEGRTLRLQLHLAKVSALGGPGFAPNGPAGTPNAADASRPSPADEAARLAAVADAVRARRQMREQAAQGGGQGAAAGGPPPSTR
jgi:hypothetical protein